MVHKPCMAIWLFTNNHFPLLLDFACHPKNLVFTQQKGTCISHRRRALEAITALKVAGEAVRALGIFFPEVKCRLVGTACVFSIGLSCWWGVPWLWRYLCLPMSDFMCKNSGRRFLWDSMCSTASSVWYVHVPCALPLSCPLGSDSHSLVSA